jgi:sporulation protein YlmC with PRC-barrel domain
MRSSRSTLLSFVALLALALAAGGALAQSATPEQPKAAVNPPASPPAQSTPAPAAPPATASALTTPAPVPAPINAKELQGLDVFSSGGQQLGKVARVTTLPDGKVKDIEVQSAGFLGMFKTTYVVPAEKVTKKGGRIELSMTSDQAKSLTR